MVRANLMKLCYDNEPLITLSKTTERLGHPRGSGACFSLFSPRDPDRRNSYSADGEPYKPELHALL
jgi:hypothetical protein